MSFRPRNRVKTKKTSSPKNEEFLFLKSCENQKKKMERTSPQFGTKFGRNLWDLFVLTASFLSDQPALKSRWGDASPLRFKYWLQAPLLFNNVA